MGAPNASGLTRIALKLKERFAAKVHNHAASDINSGTLDDARIPSLDASKIGSGTLGVARGGTGASTHTANAVLTGNGTSAMNNVATASGALYATAANGAAQFGTLPVAQGGTGADTAAGARTNLDAAQSNGASGTLKNAEDGIGDLAASIATVEQPTATASHAKNSHFIVGNELKKATEAIASGESITSSNTTDDTLQGQIDTLRDSVSGKLKLYITDPVVTIPANQSYGTISAPSDGEYAGYTFLCWIYFLTIGWMGYVYTDTPLNQSSIKVWALSTSTSARQARGVALYVKNV